MRSIFDAIVSFWDITEYAAVNWVIVGLLAPIAYVFAFKFTRRVAFLFGYNSQLMSIIHWSVRLLIYASLAKILKNMISFIAQPLILINVSAPRYVSAILIAVFMVGVAIFLKARSNINHKLFWS